MAKSYKNKSKHPLTPSSDNFLWHTSSQLDICPVTTEEDSNCVDIVDTQGIWEEVSFGEGNGLVKW